MDGKLSELDNGLSSFLRPHWFFAADDVANINTTADLIHCHRKTADAAFINIAFLYTFFGPLLRHLLLCHGLLLSSSVFTLVSFFFISS
jgi:hypothetical protein